MQPQAQQSQPNPQQVFEEAYRLLRQGDAYEAAKRAGKLRAHFPEDVPVLTLHGIVLARLGIHPQALSDLIKAAQLTEHALANEEGENPNRPRIVNQLVQLSVQICYSSMKIGEYKAAEEAIELALKWDPDRGDAVAAKAELLALQGNTDEGLKLIAQGQKDVLESFPLVVSKARIVLGQEKPDPKNIESVIKELETESQVSGLGGYELGEILRLLGTANDRVEQVDNAFHAFRRAAKLRRGTYDPRAYTMMTTKVIHDWTREAMGKMIKPAESGEKTVLLLGAPMSGVNQLAEMLGQFDDVRVVGPLETLSTVCMHNLGARQGVLRPVPFEPSKLRGGQLKEAQVAYTNHINAMAGGATRAIDTHSLNIPLAGAAAAFLPGVHIVMCRRDPMESTLACYCDAMVGNHPFAGDLVNAAGFVADCNRMMDHWATILGDESIGANIIEVQYADLESDPKKTASKVAREIGLDARATSVKSVPSFERGPGSNPKAYEQHTRVIEGFFDHAGV